MYELEDGWHDPDPWYCPMCDETFECNKKCRCPEVNILAECSVSELLDDEDIPF